jgi:hypothetical protein
MGERIVNWMRFTSFRWPLRVGRGLLRLISFLNVLPMCLFVRTFEIGIDMRDPMRLSDTEGGRMVAGHLSTTGRNLLA